MKDLAVVVACSRRCGVRVQEQLACLANEDGGLHLTLKTFVSTENAYTMATTLSIPGKIESTTARLRSREGRRYLRLKLVLLTQNRVLRRRDASCAKPFLLYNIITQIEDFA